MRLAALPPHAAAVAAIFATASAIEASVQAAAVEHDHAALCSSRCGDTFSASGPSAVCEQVCAVVHDQPEFSQCRQDLMDATVEHATLLSYNSGHVYEALSILQGSLDNSTDPALEEYRTYMDQYHLNDRGSPTACVDVQDAHYCVAQAPLFASIGLCLPKSCDSAFVGAVIANISDGAGGFDPNFVHLGQGLRNGGGGGASGVLGGPSISCGEELRVRPDMGTIAVFALIGVLVVLVLAGTAVDFYSRRHSKQKAESGGAKTSAANRKRRVGPAERAARATTGSGAMGTAVFCPITDALITATPMSWPRRGSSSTGEESKDGGDKHAEEEVPSPDAPYTGDPARQPLLSPADAAAIAEEGTPAAGDGQQQQQQGVEQGGSGESRVLARLRRMRKSEWGRWSYDRLQCFSLIINTNSLLAPPRVADEFPALDGVRTMSMMWVVLGHTFAYNVTGGGPGFTNTIAVLPQGGKGFLARLSAQVIPGGFMAVDSFFLMSGFLLSSVLLPKLENGSLTGSVGSGGMGKGWMMKAYIHRYLRLTPTLLFVTLMFWKVLPLLGEGASWWPVAHAQAESCRKYWWTEIAYVSSIFPWPPLSDGCTGVSWYLADDTMYFLLGVPTVALYHRRPRLSATLVFVAAVLSCVFTFVYYGFFQQVSFSIFTRVVNSDGWGTVYAVPWSRCSVYLVGMLCGMAWHTHFRGRIGSSAAGGGDAAGAGANGSAANGSGSITNGDGTEQAAKNPLERLAKPGKYVYWPAVVVALLSAALMGLPVYGTYWDYQDAKNPNLPPWADHLYLAFGRPTWALGLALMCMLCFCGHGGLVNWLLTRPGWTSLSRLTYCTYLFHTLLLTLLYGTRDQPIELTGLEFAVTYMGIVFGTFLGGTGLHLLVEAPFRNLESMGRRQKKKQLQSKH
ncbi:conserved unknown protein [Ectocarpus siliculosus]|uniref:Acyltransferase 3 domain-containing protein n=1 Tax=Ectocarpus siliculosus TaxID=2880 RepID=D7G7D7_ECTSI|nr:conserved unknown protein [Ectocarpus siliculosus]|eukprot:CBJ27688.1 conserved unknown protein [Ectocarpus siliculosus]